MMLKSKYQALQKSIAYITVYTLCIDTIKQLGQITGKINVKFINLEIVNPIKKKNRKYIKTFFQLKIVYIPIAIQFKYKIR